MYGNSNPPRYAIPPSFIQPQRQLQYYPIAHNYRMPAFAYNNYTFTNNQQNSNQQLQQNSKLRNYNNNKQRIEPKHSPVTLTWNLNVYVEEEKEGFIKRCCKRSKKAEPIENGNLNYKGYPQPYRPQYPPNVTPNEPDQKVIHILKNVTGCVPPGKLCAIMGPSGSGKTSLLNCLNFRNRGKLIIEGDIKVNGKDVTWKHLSRYSGYVQQEDLYIGTLKVKEHLTFLAFLKMDKHLSKEVKTERVEEVMLEMNLKHIEDTYIGQGDRLKGISGGEKRRLAFASEVLTHPQLLFADEPTTGLDAFMALSICESMSQIAKQGKTVISTIHQPSSQIFEKFDMLCLLADGRVAFMGLTKDAPAFFQSMGHPSPPLYNPADHYLQVISTVPTKREQSLQQIKRVCDGFQRSQQNQNNLRLIVEAKQRGLSYDESKEKKTVNNASILTQTYWLFWRQTLNSIREPFSSKIMLAQSIIIAVFFGLTYLQTKKDENGVQNLNGLLFLLLMQTNFGFIFPIINTFPTELNVFYRESKNRVYSVTPYYVSKLLSETPKYLFVSFLMVTIIYWMAGILNDGKTYILVILLYMLVSQIAMGAGIVLSILSPNIEVATALAAPLLLPLIIYGGFFLNNASTPVYFIWLKYLSWFYYGFDAILIQFWSNVPSIACTATVNQYNCTSSRCYKDGYAVLKQLDVSTSTMSRDIGLLFTLFTVPRILGLILLKFKAARL